MSTPKPPSTPKSLDKNNTVAKSPSSVKTKVPVTSDQANKPIKEKVPKTPQTDNDTSKALLAPQAYSAEKKIKKKVPLQPTQLTEKSGKSEKSAVLEQSQDPVSGIKKKPKLPADAPNADTLDPTGKLSDNVDHVKKEAEDTAPAQEAPKTPKSETPKMAERLKDDVKRQTPKFMSHIPEGEDALKLIKKKIKKPEAPAASLQPEPEIEGFEAQAESDEEYIEKRSELKEQDEKHSEPGDEQDEKRSESDDEHPGIDMHDNEREDDASDLDVSEHEDAEEKNEDESEDQEEQEEYEESEPEESGGEEEDEIDIFGTPTNDVSKLPSSGPGVTSKGQDTPNKSTNVPKGTPDAANDLAETRHQAANRTANKSSGLAGNISGVNALNHDSLSSATDTAKYAGYKVTRAATGAPDAGKDKTDCGARAKAGSLSKSAEEVVGDATESISDVGNIVKGAASGLKKEVTRGGNLAKGLPESTKGKAQDGKNEIKGITSDIAAKPDSVFAKNATKDVKDAKEKASGMLDSGKKTASGAACLGQEKAVRARGKAASGLGNSQDSIGGISKQGTGGIGDTANKLPLDMIKGIEGEVVDDSGQELAMATGDTSSMAGKTVNEKGEILDEDKVVGVVSDLAGGKDQGVNALVKGFTAEGGGGSVNAGGIQISVQTTKDGMRLTINIPGSFQQ